MWVSGAHFSAHPAKMAANSMAVSVSTVEKSKKSYSKLASGLHTCIRGKPRLRAYNFGSLEVLD